MDKTPAMKALEFYNTQQVPNHGLGYSDGSIMLIETIRTILESHDQMRETMRLAKHYIDPNLDIYKQLEALAKTAPLEEKI